METAVTIPWGDMVLSGINILLPTALTILSGVATYVVGKYMPPWLRAFAGDAAQRRVNQVLQKAVLSAVAQTSGAVKGQVLSVPIASEVLRKAIQYAVDQAPELIGHAAKDKYSNLIKMLLARMEEFGMTPPEMDVADVKPTLVPTPSPTGGGGPISGPGSKVETGSFDFSGSISKGLGG